MEAARKLRQGQIEQSVFIAEDETALFFVRLPILATHKSGRFHALGLAQNGIARFIGLIADDDGGIFLDDACFFTRNGGEPTGIWLLYGPSVDQVFRGVAAKRTSDIADLVMKKFYRQFSRL